jgi:gliding motility-associated-like protein
MKFPSLQGVFDPNRGVLFIIGTASPEVYSQALRTIEYDYKNVEQNPLSDSTKVLYVFARDGEATSQTKEREITMISTIQLDIPNSFTPNGDMANDTWKISPNNTSDDYKDALIRVYNIRGMIVYESTGLENEWDGNHDGSAVPSDTYYYTINLNLNYTRATYRGIVTILR